MIPEWLTEKSKLIQNVPLRKYIVEAFLKEVVLQRNKIRENLNVLLHWSTTTQEHIFWSIVHNNIFQKNIIDLKSELKLITILYSKGIKLKSNYYLK